MKGIIFNLYEDYVNSKISMYTYEDVYDNSGKVTEEPYVGPGTYEDSDFLKLVERTSFLTEKPVETICEEFGNYCFAKLAAMVPDFIDQHSTTRTFFPTLNDVVNHEVRKLYSDADVPVFEFHEEENTLRIRYRSSRKLYYLGLGMLRGGIRYFDDQATVEWSLHESDEDTYADYILTYQEK